MHETLGDGYITESGKRIYADEDLGIGRDATQFRHQEANSFQEEIANVIRSEGITLNAPDEAISSMNQLNSAITQKINNGVSAEAALRIAGDNTLAAIIAALTSTSVANSSTVAGAKVTNALDNLKVMIESLRDELVTPSTPLPIAVGPGAVWNDAGSWVKYRTFGVSSPVIMMWGKINGQITITASNIIDLQVQSLGGIWTGKTLSFLYGATHGFLGSGFESIKMFTPPASIGLRFERLANYLGSHPFPLATGMEIPFSILGHVQ